MPAEAQLDIAGINYARTIYDTLTSRTTRASIVPYLAKSVDHNADNTVWTIGCATASSSTTAARSRATVVKNNLDAYRGTTRTGSRSCSCFVFGPYIERRSTSSTRSP